MYGVKAPRVKTHSGAEWSFYDPDNAVISMQYDQMNTEIALHEAAHAIVFLTCKQEADEESDDYFEDHGAEFLGVLLYLLHEFGVAPLVALTASARDAGLRFISVAGSAPLPFRQRVARVLA